MIYDVTISGRSYQVDVTESGIRIDGEPIEAELTVVDGESLRLRLGDGVHAVHARRGAVNGLWMIHVAGRGYEAEVTDERTRIIRSLAGPAATARATHLIAPMPGLVVRINVRVGDRVTAGQGLVVVEAMKMENELRAPSDGVVEQIAVAPGEAVEKGKELIRVKGDG